jgi:glycerol-3-phosphate acyltransferase PlsY
MQPLIAVLILAIGFLCGSLPTALLLGRLKRIDIREHGSGNIGATNVLRVMGKGWGVLCLAVDVFKGWLPVYLASYLFLLSGLTYLTVDAWMWLAGVAAIFGHMFTPFLNFKGGKGVATSVGVFIAIAPIPLLICVVLALVIVWLTGWISLASVVCSAMLPVLILIERPARGMNVPWTSIGVTLVLALLIAWKHRTNIQRIRAGTEPRLFDQIDGVAPPSSSPSGPDAGGNPS